MTRMAQMPWPRQQPPRTAPEPAAAVLVAGAAPSSAREMSSMRRRLSAAVRSSHPVVSALVPADAAPEEVPHGEDAELGDDLERLDLVLEELASNGVRHGRAPVEVAVHVADGGWLVAVTDAAPDRPPLAVTDRDPARGGMGLQMVARLADDHGWSVTGARKTVWALIAPR